jgi:hypothetical protein
MGRDFFIKETEMNRSLRTVLTIVALTAGSLAAAPSNAQFMHDWGAGEFYDGPSRLCLSGNYSIRRAISRQGYSNIFLNVENDPRIEARATKGKWVYLLDVNSCSGRVLSRKRLRPA